MAVFRDITNHGGVDVAYTEKEHILCSIRTSRWYNRATEEKMRPNPSVIMRMTNCHQNEYVYYPQCIAQVTGDPNDDRTQQPRFPQNH